MCACVCTWAAAGVLGVCACDVCVCFCAWQRGEEKGREEARR